MAAKEIRRIHAEREAKWAEEAARRKESSDDGSSRSTGRSFWKGSLSGTPRCLLARCDLAKLRDKPEAATVVDLRVDSSGDRKPRFSPEALALRFDKAEFATDEADVPSWRKVD